MPGRGIERDERDGPQHGIGREFSGKPGVRRAERTDNLTEHRNRRETGDRSIGTASRPGVAVLRMAAAVVTVRGTGVAVRTGIPMAGSAQWDADVGIHPRQRDLDGGPVANKREHRQEGDGEDPGGEPPGAWRGRSGKEDSKTHGQPKIGGAPVGGKAVRPPKRTRTAWGPAIRGYSRELGEKELSAGGCDGGRRGSALRALAFPLLLRGR